jgi:hypothetical protein
MICEIERLRELNSKSHQRESVHPRSHSNKLWEMSNGGYDRIVLDVRVTMT